MKEAARSARAAVAVAVTEAVAEADQSIHDQSIHDPSIRVGVWGPKLPKSARGGGDGGGAPSGQTLPSPSCTQE